MNQTVLIGTVFLAVTILAALRTSLGAARRIRRERRDFRMAIESVAVETPRFWLLGLVPAIILAVVAILAGLILPPSLIVMLGVVSAATVLVPNFSPLWLGMAGGVTVLLPASLQTQLGLTKVAPTTWAGPFAVLMMLVALANVIATVKAPYHESPRLTTKHSRLTAVYAVRQLLWVPLVLPIPGNLVAALPYWPTLHIGATSFGLAFLPLILGFGFTHRSPAAQPISRRRARVTAVVAVADAIVAGMLWAHVTPAVVGLTIVAGVGLIGALLELLVSRSHLVINAPSGGVRVIATLVNTPAEKMGLMHGETILQCNGRELRSPKDLYAAVQELGTFCRLRVQGVDGQIRLTETAIFKGTPHMLGVITFPEE